MKIKTTINISAPSYEFVNSSKGGTFSGRLEKLIQNVQKLPYSLSKKVIKLMVTNNVSAPDDFFNQEETKQLCAIIDKHLWGL